MGSPKGPWGLLGIAGDEMNKQEFETQASDLGYDGP